MPAASTGRAPLVENVRGSIYGEPQPVPTEFRNVDGERLRTAAAPRSGKKPPERRRETRERLPDPVRTFAYGTDASFYRLIPKMVLKVETEREIGLKLARKHRRRSPSARRGRRCRPGGADSILLKLSHTGKNWRRHAVETKGKRSPSSPASSVAGSIVYREHAKRHEGHDVSVGARPRCRLVHDQCRGVLPQRRVGGAAGVRNRVDGATRRRRRRGVRRCIETPTHYRRLTHNTRGGIVNNLVGRNAAWPRTRIIPPPRVDWRCRLLSWTNPTPNRAESSIGSRLSARRCEERLGASEEVKLEELMTLINRKFRSCTTGYYKCLSKASPDEPSR